MKNPLMHSPIVGFSLGFLPFLIFSGNFFAASTVGFLAAYIQYLFLLKPKTDSGNNIFKEESAYSHILLSLVAAVIKVDGTVSESELKFIENKLRKDYPKILADTRMAELKIALNQIHPLINYTKTVDFEFDLSGKIQLMHLLVGIATADGILKDSELKLLTDICIDIDLKISTLKAILAMFRFQTEHKQYKNQSKNKLPENLIQDAYLILEVSSMSSNEEIKKAYKKLAILHHPDKVAHLGEEFQKAASEKFKIIVNAYDLLCKKRGIS